MTADEHDELLTPLVKGWQGKIDLAIKHKRANFGDIADQCMQFFSGVVGFMYESKFQKKYIGGNFNPTFKLTLNKAFEIVALYLPVIYNRNPIREVRPPEPFDFGPEVFGDPNDPQVQAMFQQAQAQEQQRHALLKSGCQACERYLRYTPDEQPNGGLQQASEDAVIEALVKGRGVLWPDTFTMPGSDVRLTGSFYDTVDRLLVDPDSESTNFGEAYWIAREMIEPHWKVERERGLPYGSLRNKGNLESSSAQGARRGNKRGARERGLGNTFDLVRYWKLWSIGGVGTRLTGTTKLLQEAFDDVVGDYAYLEIAAGVPWPLNMPRDRFLEATDEEVQKAFSWPVPYWKDQRWPAVILDFYRQPNCSWPISPLRPGLGELTALNIILSHLTGHIYQNSKTLIAVMKSAQKDVEGALKKGGDLVVLGVPEILKDIRSLIQFIQGPPVNYDVWKIIDHLFNLFDKRVGLSDLLFGMNPGAASRTAPDAETKRDALSIRPDYLASKVEQWQVEATRNEKICAYYSGVNGNNLRPLLGDVGAHIFDRTFANADEETVLREMTCSVVAGSARKPNRQRDAENLKEIYQPRSIQLMQYAETTGDTGPMNELNSRLDEAMEIKPGVAEMGPLAPPEPEGPPPPDPEQEAKAQQIQQDLAIKAQQAQQDLMVKTQQAQQGMAIEAAEGQQKMILSGAEHQQQIQQQEEAHTVDMLVQLAKAEAAKKAQTQKKAG